MTKETINQNNVPLIVKYNVKGDLSEIFNEFDYEQLFSADFSKLGKEMQLLDIIVPQELNFRVTALKDEVRMANLFIDLFLGVFIVLSGILLVVFMRKYIEKNKRDIKILNSMGYNEKEITLSLLAFPLFVSLMSLLGYVIGLLIAALGFAMVPPMLVDLAEGHVAALDALASHPGCTAVNLGTGRGYSVLEVVTAAEAVLGRPIPHEVVGRRPGDVARIWAGTERAEHVLGWTATRDLAEMLADHWRWQEANPDGFGD